MKRNKFTITISAIILALSVACFVVGICTPLMTTRYQVLGINLKSWDITMFDSIKLFWQSKDYLISGVILIFTFILPISKYIELTLRLITGKEYPTLASVDKWNMIDVFIVAMLLLNFRMNSSFIVMELQWGTSLIALAVMLRLVSIILIEKTYNNKANSGLF